MERVFLLFCFFSPLLGASNVQTLDCLWSVLSASNPKVSALFDELERNRIGLIHMHGMMIHNEYRDSAIELLKSIRTLGLSVEDRLVLAKKIAKDIPIAFDTKGRVDLFDLDESQRFEVAMIGIGPSRTYVEGWDGPQSAYTACPLMWVDSYKIEKPEFRLALAEAYLRTPPKIVFRKNTEAVFEQFGGNPFSLEALAHYLHLDAAQISVLHRFVSS